MSTLNAVSRRWMFSFSTIRKRKKTTIIRSSVFPCGRCACSAAAVCLCTELGVNIAKSVSALRFGTHHSGLVSANVLAASDAREVRSCTECLRHPTHAHWNLSPAIRAFPLLLVMLSVAIQHAPSCRTVHRTLPNVAVRSTESSSQPLHPCWPARSFTLADRRMCRGNGYTTSHSKRSERISLIRTLARHRRVVDALASDLLSLKVISWI